MRLVLCDSRKYIQHRNISIHKNAVVINNNTCTSRLSSIRLTASSSREAILSTRWILKCSRGIAWRSCEPLHEQALYRYRHHGSSFLSRTRVQISMLQYYSNILIASCHTARGLDRRSPLARLYDATLVTTCFVYRESRIRCWVYANTLGEYRGQLPMPGCFHGRASV